MDLDEGSQPLPHPAPLPGGAGVEGTGSPPTPIGGARDWPPGQAAGTRSPGSQGQPRLPQSEPCSPLSGSAPPAASLASGISVSVIRWHAVNVICCLHCRFRVAGWKWCHPRNSTQRLLIAPLSEQPAWHGEPPLPSVPSPSLSGATFIRLPVLFCRGVQFPQIPVL